MYKICVITATRAEYGLLRPLLYKLKDHNDLLLQLVVTGTHLSDKFGNTQNEIKADGFTDYVSVPIPLDDDSKCGMAIATGSVTEKFASVFDELTPDIVVILGDRYEMLGVATAAHLMNIPIAHMCGGDVTEGAVDDAIRHCITKLSYLHFTGCRQSANRVIQMGEEPGRVFDVGEPGIENCLNEKLLTKLEFAKQIGFEGAKGDFCVVTFHPVTMENNTAKEQTYELIKAMDYFTDLSYIITKANADAGGRVINEIWEREAQTRKHWHVVNSLGMLRYLSAVKYAQLVLGNSSSGLVEVPAFKVPTINIGVRQKGRMMAKSVICCQPYSEEIINAMRLGLTIEFRESFHDMELPFGDGHTSEKVLEELIRYLRNNDKTNIKKFYDISF